MTDKDQIEEYIDEVARDCQARMKKYMDMQAAEYLKEFEGKLNSLREAAEMDVTTNDLVDMILRGGSFEVGEYEGEYDGDRWARLELDNRTWLNWKLNLKKGTKYRAIVIIRPVGEVEAEDAAAAVHGGEGGPAQVG